MANLFHKNLVGDDLHIARTTVQASTPVGSITPGIIGEFNWDSDGNKLYIAEGVTSSDWIFAGGETDEWIELSDTANAIEADLSVQGNSAGTALEFGQNLTTTGEPTFTAYQIGGTRVLFGDPTNFNLSVGQGAGPAFTGAGIRNTAVGIDALNLATTNTDNTAVGYNALSASILNADFNTAVGSLALESHTTGDGNTALGNTAMQDNTTGGFSTGVGYRALLQTTEGDFNTGIGALSLRNNTVGQSNTALGYQAGTDLAAITNVGENTLIGYNCGLGITTGVQNTILGANVTGLAATLSNNIIIADGSGLARLQFDSAGGGTVTGGFSLDSTTEVLRLPRLTTTQRDALTPLTGFEIFNTTTLEAEVYDGTIWQGSGGNVNGPVSSVDTTLALFSGTTGKLIAEASGLTFDGSSLNFSGNLGIAAVLGFDLTATGITETATTGNISLTATAGDILFNSLIDIDTAGQVITLTSASGTGTPAVNFDDSSNVNQASIVFTEVDEDLTITAGAGDLRLVSISSDIEILSGSGFVGVGIADPVSSLHLFENTANTGISAGFIVEQEGAGDAVIHFVTNTDTWTFGHDQSLDHFAIQPASALNSAAAIQILPSSEIGINKTPRANHCLDIGTLTNTVVALYDTKDVTIEQGNNDNTNSTDLFFNRADVGFNQSEFHLFNGNNNVDNRRLFHMNFTDAGSTGGLAVFYSGFVSVGIGENEPNGADTLLHLRSDGPQEVAVLTLETTGLGGEIARTFVGDSDPVGAVTGNPGDTFIHVNGAASGALFHRGASSDNTSWVAMATGGNVTTTDVLTNNVLLRGAGGVDIDAIQSATGTISTNTAGNTIEIASGPTGTASFVLQDDSSIDRVVLEYDIDANTANLTTNVALSVLSNQALAISRSTADTFAVLALETTGTNGARTETFVGNRTPVGNVTGSPGDRYLSVNAASSAVFIHQGATSDNTSWTDTSINTNFANTNLTLDTTRVHQLDGNPLVFEEGSNVLLSISSGQAQLRFNDNIFEADATGVQLNVEAGNLIQLNSNSADTLALLSMETNGTNGAEKSVFIGNRDPNGNITGVGGDEYNRSDTTTSGTYESREATTGTGWFKRSVNPASTFEINTAAEFEALASGGVITITSNTTIIFKVDVVTTTVFSIEGNADLTLSSPSDNNFIYVDTGTVFTLSGAVGAALIVRDMSLVTFSTGTWFDVTGGVDLAAVATRVDLSNMLIFGGFLGTFQRGVGAPIGPIFNIFNSTLANRLGGLVCSDTFVSMGDILLASVGGVTSSEPFIELSTTTSEAQPALFHDFVVSLGSGESFIRVDAGINDTSAVTIRGIQADVLEDAVGLFDTSGATGTFTAVADAAVAATAITSVSNVTDDIARFNFTVGPTLFVNQEVVISGFTTNTIYNQTALITAVGVGFFEVDYIAFGSDETGSFLSNSVTMTDTGTSLVDGDSIKLDTDDATDYDGGAIVYNQLTNTFQVNKAFTQTESGTWSQEGLDQTDFLVLADNNPQFVSSKYIATSFVNDNSTANGAIVNNVFTDMVFGTGGSALVEGSTIERFKLIDELDGTFEYTGREPFDGYITFDFTVESSGGAVEFRFKWVRDSNAVVSNSFISFADANPDEIFSQFNDFITAGFNVDDQIDVSGSTSNDGTYTIAQVNAGKITLVGSDTLVNEGAGAAVTITALETDLADNVEASATVGSNSRSVTKTYPLSVTTGDQIKPQITRNTGTSGITTRYATIFASQ